jgi:hypothetical protein
MPSSLGKAFGNVIKTAISHGPLKANPGSHRKRLPDPVEHIPNYVVIALPGVGSKNR